MDFTEALEYMKAGKRVVRPAMAAGSYFEFAALGGDGITPFLKYTAPIHRPIISAPTPILERANDFSLYQG